MVRYKAAFPETRPEFSEVGVAVIGKVQKALTCSNSGNHGVVQGTENCGVDPRGVQFYRKTCRRRLQLNSANEVCDRN